MERRSPGMALGALAGLLLTAPLLALGHLGWTFAGLPFAPYVLFDRLTRALPGAIVTAGIDSLVAALGALEVADTAAAAKTAERVMAVAIFLALGAAVGAALFAMARGGERRAVRLGALLGAIAGIAVLLAGHGRASASAAAPAVAALWTLVLLAAWGATLGAVQRRLATAGDRPAAPAVEPLDRRRFLIRLGGASAAFTVGGAVVDLVLGDRGPGAPAAGERWSERHAPPNEASAVEPAPGTRPEITSLEEHYRIDINAASPSIDVESWRLAVGGLVERPLELTLDELRSYPATELFVTLACISNPVGGDLIGTTRWTGVSLQRLLPDLGLRPEATHLRLRSADGFFETVALATVRADERAMLCYAWDGVPLTAGHGFPLRVYLPDRYGMKQPKWIVSIEALDAWQPGYWVVRGWDREARMEATSVIDTVAIEHATSGGDGTPQVPVGGIAHAGARGISRVEVQLDDGAWREARLRRPLSPLTWVLWRLDLPIEPGEHRLTVRCFDGNGAAQVVEPSPPHPDGATGLHRVEASI